MSPTENDLRNSLQQGAGEPIDVDRIVAAGAAARTQRRTRLAGAAAAVVVVVAAASITGVVLARDDSGRTTADSGGYAQSRTNDGAAIAPGEPAPTSASASSTDAPTASRAPAPAAECPATFPQRSLPGGAKAGALFDRPAASITVCSYGTPLQSSGGARPVGVSITGTRAAELQRSLENARSTPSTPCTTVRPADRRNLAFVAVDAAGASMRVVTTTLSVPICDTRTTNGLTVRFGWVPPLGLRQQLYALTPDGAPSSLPDRVPSGKNIGTPAR